MERMEKKGLIMMSVLFKQLKDNCIIKKEKIRFICKNYTAKNEKLLLSKYQIKKIY
jgi:hypothetical protein